MAAMATARAITAIHHGLEPIARGCAGRTRPAETSSTTIRDENFGSDSVSGIAWSPFHGCWLTSTAQGCGSCATLRHSMFFWIRGAAAEAKHRRAQGTQWMAQDPGPSPRPLRVHRGPDRRAATRLPALIFQKNRWPVD